MHRGRSCTHSVASPASGALPSSERPHLLRALFRRPVTIRRCSCEPSLTYVQYSSRVFWAVCCVDVRALGDPFVVVDDFWIWIWLASIFVVSLFAVGGSKHLQHWCHKSWRVAGSSIFSKWSLVLVSRTFFHGCRKSGRKPLVRTIFSFCK